MKTNFLVLLAMFFTLAAAAQVQEHVSYTIESTLLSPQVVEVGGANKDDRANVNLWQWKGLPHQKWQFIRASDGYWFIKNDNSGKVLDFENGNDKPGSSVYQYTPNFSVAQQFKLIAAGDGSYYIVSNGGNYVTCETVHGKNGSNIMLWNKCEGSKFRFFAQ